MKFDMQYFLTSKNARWLILFLIVLFSVLIFSEFTKYVMNPIPSITHSEKVTDEVKETKPTTVQHIVNSPLFGVYVPDNLNDGSVKKSRLKLVVVGILLADRSDNSQVIIRNATGVEKTYNVGDTLPDGVKIERITADGILIEHGGVVESLSLPKNDLLFEPVPEPLQED